MLVNMVLRPSRSKGIPNTFLRKKRKWPHSPYITKWHHNFNQQQALQSLKKSTLTQNPSLNSPSFLLTSMTNSFQSYNCDPTPNAYNFILKTLTQKTQFKDLNFVMTHLQKVQSFDTPEHIFVDLIRVYGENGMFKEAVDLFFRIPKFRCVPTVVSLNALLLILCKSSELLCVVPQLLLKSRVMNIRVDESSFYVLVNALCRIGKVGYAIKLLNYLIDHDEYDPDGKFYSLILSALCKQKGDCGSNFDVMGVFEDMKGVGFCPGREDFRNVIKFLSKKGEGKAAFGVLCEMKRGGIKPDIVCYTRVLYGVVEEGEYSRAEELFDEILLFGLIPHLRTYNVYIKGLCKQDKIDDAYRMIGSMEELGCPADFITYKTVLEGFCKVGDLNRAREVWEEMKRNGMEWNPQAYMTMINALAGGHEVIEACNWLEEMLSRNLTPLGSTLDEIVCGLCQVGLIDKAIKIIGELSGHDVLPGYNSWKALLLGLKLRTDCVKEELSELLNLDEE